MVMETLVLDPSLLPAGSTLTVSIPAQRTNSGDRGGPSSASSRGGTPSALSPDLRRSLSSYSGMIETVGELRLRHPHAAVSLKPTPRSLIEPPSPGMSPGATVPSPGGSMLPPAPRSPWAAGRVGATRVPSNEQPSQSQHIKLKLPPGCSGGQTLLLTVQRPPEHLEVTVPDNAHPGDTLVAKTCLGHDVHIPCPAGVVAGSRLLMQVPLPPQTVRVTTPSEARAGSQIYFPLPSPLEERSTASELANGGGGVDLASGRRSDGKRKMLEAGASGGGVGAGGSGVGSSGGAVGTGAGPGRPSKKGRHPLRDDSALLAVHSEGQQALRTFRSGEGRCMPEAVATWALCDALRPRLSLPPLTLPHLEAMLSGLSGGSHPPGSGGHGKSAGAADGLDGSASHGAPSPHPDRVLGSLYVWVEQFFQPALHIGFASKFS